ncbi:type-F conjugative transfer system protein TraW [Vibrio parahaemolyticus]|uniref:Type-F conjugative transfer system protein TraW n=1 Tax=Vibrio parahaemolyticus TaxID=670 RepID=A0A9Q3YNW9_VIBPH|nr:type-F conjugative transfer system protein TraW [Vibrio parahaemolyticus]EGQ8101947.1 type-F conjugative transfer system protein TraW [Vibrio parahaemolyticus]EGQ8548732.1 type-F conjugative transfer system protein TraW [Vibrio parahaemolyticus]EGQ9073831.1 type-F conjugative transfer system protein TraW [Vibrio parahaemolyticus]EGQ9129654.1 type-F conjugative transfer system protein TraW [Vibrio parahaemolyticus]EGQ9286413.1 type-F conjugative transfer system protein TraW [Vibrio parahaemo
MPRPSSALTCALLLLCTAAQAKHLGRQGEVFPIAEIDMLEWIDARLKHLETTGQTARMQQDFIERVESSVQRPAPVEGLTTTTAPRIFYIDPSLKLATDIKDAQGNLIYAKGLVINPFDTATWPIDIPKVQFEYQHTLVFLDGDDVRQRTWAKQYSSDKPIKWILTNGSPDELASDFDARIYFDQKGNYSRQFQLANTPSVITQDGKRWKVTEIDVTPFTNAMMETTTE